MLDNIKPHSIGAFLLPDKKLEKLPKKSPLCKKSIPLPQGGHRQKIPIREAIFAPRELVLAENAAGRICAAPTVSCPPAIPIVISGEEITPADVELFRFYGIDRVAVIK